MAGESPDKVERRESSGETTDDLTAVASTDGKKSGKKSGKNHERKRGAEPETARSDAADEPGEARDEAAGDGASAPSEPSADEGGETEAEAADGARDGASPDGFEAAATAGGGEGNGRSDDRLKAAVAAWVAGTDDEPGGSGHAAESDGQSTEKTPDVKNESANSGSGEKNSSQIPAGELPVRPKSADGGEPDAEGDPGGASGSGDVSGTGGSGDVKAPKGSDGAESAAKAPAGVDHPTAMFRTVRPGEDDFAAATDSEEAARRAERMTAAFFGSGKPAQSGGDEEGGPAEETEGTGAGDAAGAADASEAADAAEGAAEAPESAQAAESVEVPETPETPESVTAPESTETPESTEADAAEETGGQSEAAGGGRVDEPTAVFRVPSGEASKDRAAKSAEAEQAEEAPGDEVSRGKASREEAAPNDGSGDESSGRDGSGAGRVDQPTAVFRTVEPGSRDKADAESKTASKTESPAAGAKGTKDAEADKDTKADKADKADKGAKAGSSAGTGEAEKPEAAAKTGAAGTKDADAKSADAPSKPVDPRVAGASAPSGAAAESDGDTGDGKKAGEDKQRPEPGAKPGTGEDKSPSPDGKSPSPDEKSRPGDDESDSERTSQFVPLRSADAPPRPTRAPGPVVPPKPESPPAAAGALPPEAEPQQQLSEAELTRQQVRPDQAPLDLLAQLTNTPPPPETPLRTAVRRVKIWTPLVVVLAILFAIAQAVRPLPDPELSLSASPTYSFQGHKPSVPWPSEGQAALEVQGLGSLGTYGKQKPVPIASVAKVMTAYVILRDHPVKKGSDGAKIPVDKKAEKEAGLSAQNESTVEVKKGDTLSEREAVQAVMIASANNVARLLARWDAGSEKAFAKKMNKAADELGMKNTEYTDPSGLTSSTVSTAADQVKLAKKAMDIDVFRETVRMPGYTDTKGDRHGNWNKLVPLDGVVGIKTGTTTKAGGNLLFAAEQSVGGTRQLIVGAVLGQYEPSILDTVLGESKKLIDTAQDSLRAQKVVRKGEVVGYVDDQLGGKTPVVASRDVSAVGWSGLKVKLGLTDGGKALPHEGKAGDRAGTLTVGDGPGQVRVPVKLKEDMTAPGFGAKLTRIL